MTKNINNSSMTFTGAVNGKYESVNRDGDVTLTVNGSGFGGAPSILLWGKFTDGNTDIPALETDLEIGSFDGLQHLRPNYFSLDGTTGISGSQGGVTSATNLTCGFILNFTACTEYFARYSMGVNSAAGRTFSGSATPYVMPTDSSLKPLWFFSGAPDSATEPDIVIGSWTSANFAIAGNQTSANISIGSGFTFDKFNSISCYQKAGNNPVLDDGITIATRSNPGAGTFTYTKTDAPMFPAIGTPAYDYAVFQGWKGNGDQDLTLNIYRYLYVATGANAGNRVELGDDAVYENCGEPVVAPHSVWTDTQYVSRPIDSKMRKGKTHWFRFLDGLLIDSGLIKDNI